MTAETLAKLINTAVVGEIAVVSLALLRAYHFPFLSHWTLAYALTFGGLLVDTIAEARPEARSLRLAEVLLLGAAAHQYLLCAATIPGREAPRKLHALPLGVLLVSGALAAAGQPFLGFAAPVVLLLSGSYLYVAWAVWNHALDPAGGRVVWLVIPFILLGLSPALYPLLSPRAYGWLGYCVAGAGHQAVGAVIGLFAYRRGVQAFEKAQRDLDRVRDQFVAGISHELRSPVAALRGAVDMLGAGVTLTDEDFPELLDVLERNTRQLHSIIDGLCDIAGTVDPLGNIRLSVVEVSSLVEETIERCETLARVRNTRLLLWPRPAPVSALASPEHLTSALRALAVTVISFSSEPTTVIFSIVASGIWVDISIGVDPTQAPPAMQPSGPSGGGGAAGIAGGFCSKLLQQQQGELLIRQDASGFRFTARLPAA